VYTLAKFVCILLAKLCVYASKTVCIFRWSRSWDILSKEFAKRPPTLLELEVQPIFLWHHIPHLLMHGDINLLAIFWVLETFLAKGSEFCNIKQRTESSQEEWVKSYKQIPDECWLIM